MGWKANILIATTRNGPAVTNSETHDPVFAQRILRELPLSDYQLIGPATFETGIYPADDELFIGAYPQSVLICHAGLSMQCIEDDWQPVLRAIQNILPDADSGAFILHSVVNLYGYALFRGMSRVRARAGADGDDEYLNEGTWLPEEGPLFEGSEIRNGERIFRREFQDEIEELRSSEMGEEFVFELSRHFFDQRIDRLDSWDIPMEQFRSSKPSFISRLIGS